LSVDRRDRSPRDVSRVEERDRLLGAVVQNADARDTEFRSRRPEPRRRASWAYGLAFAVLAIAARVAIAPPAFLQDGPPPVAAAEDLLRGTESRLLLQAWQVEVFRVREGRLPDSLPQVRALLPGIRYVRSDARVYQLVARGPDGEPVIYDSALPGGGLAATLNPNVAGGAP
jgi:hypothetical protein